jgi:hypothetical protein
MVQRCHGRQGGVTGVGLVDNIRRDTYKRYTRTTTTELLLFTTDVAWSGKAGKFSMSAVQSFCAKEFTFFIYTIFGTVRSKALYVIPAMVGYQREETSLD